MRKWFKYSLGSGPAGTRIPIDQNFSDHAAGMGGYDIDESYANDELLFRDYFYGFHQGRLERYYDFISENLLKDINILSIASGRGVLEYYLKKKGYNSICCSDLEDSASCTKLGLNFLKLDILESISEDSYDAIVCLSLIYLFDDPQLSLFFENVQKKVKQNGILILDSAGSPDTFLSHIVNEVYLFLEMWFYRFYKSCIDKKWYHVQIKHFGYRRTDQEIISLAKKNGFVLDCSEKYNYLTEFRRSMIFRKLVREGSFFEKIVCKIFGKRLPYIRMFKFQSIA